MSALRLLGAQAAVATLAGLMSWIAAPSNGVQLHWNPDVTDPWRAPAIGHALVVPIVVFVLGRIITSVVNAGSERTQRPLRIDCAAGAALIAFAGLQRLPDFSVLLVLAGAVVAGLAVYSAMSALSAGGVSDSP